MPASKEGESPEWLEQIVPYYGGEGKSVGHKNSIRSGIVGKAVREKAPHTAKRPNADYNQYIQELMSKWSYTEADARRLSPDRMAWMAVPMFSSKVNEVVAVIFLDSNDPNFFTKPVQELIMSACGGIATYLEEKYLCCKVESTDFGQQAKFSVVVVHSGSLRRASLASFVVLD